MTDNDFSKDWKIYSLNFQCLEEIDVRRSGSSPYYSPPFSLAKARKTAQN